MSASALVKLVRLRAGLTQAELAARCDTTQSAIARIERGASEPSMTRVEAIARQCGFDITIAVTPIDPTEEETLRRNLRMTPDERVHRIANAGRFILAAREAREKSAVA